MKITIKDLGFYQKLFQEAIKYPMKLKTAEMMEKFLKTTDEIVKQALEDFGMEEKKKAVVDALNKEVAEKFDEEKSLEANKDKTPDELKKSIAEEISKTTAVAKEKEITEEFMKMEVEVEPTVYVLDESLPGMFNITMRDDNKGVILFRQREVSKK